MSYPLPRALVMEGVPWKVLYALDASFSFVSALLSAASSFVVSLLCPHTLLSIPSPGFVDVKLLHKGSPVFRSCFDLIIIFDLLVWLEVIFVALLVYRSFFSSVKRPTAAASRVHAEPDYRSASTSASVRFRISIDELPGAAQPVYSSASTTVRFQISIDKLPGAAQPAHRSASTTVRFQISIDELADAAQPVHRSASTTVRVQIIIDELPGAAQSVVRHCPDCRPISDDAGVPPAAQRGLVSEDETVPSPAPTKPSLTVGNIEQDEREYVKKLVMNGDTASSHVPSGSLSIVRTALAPDVPEPYLTKTKVNTEQFLRSAAEGVVLTVGGYSALVSALYPSSPSPLLCLLATAIRVPMTTRAPFIETQLGIPRSLPDIGYFRCLSLSSWPSLMSAMRGGSSSTRTLMDAPKSGAVVVHNTAAYRQRWVSTATYIGVIIGQRVVLLPLLALSLPDAAPFRHLSPASRHVISLLVPSGSARLCARALIGAPELSTITARCKALVLWVPLNITVVIVCSQREAFSHSIPLALLTPTPFRNLCVLSYYRAFLLRLAIRRERSPVRAVICAPEPTAGRNHSQSLVLWTPSFSTVIVVLHGKPKHASVSIPRSLVYPGHFHHLSLVSWYRAFQRVPLRCRARPKAPSRTLALQLWYPTVVKVLFCSARSLTPSNPARSLFMSSIVPCAARRASLTCLTPALASSSTDDGLSALVAVNDMCPSSATVPRLLWALCSGSPLPYISLFPPPHVCTIAAFSLTVNGVSGLLITATFFPHANSSYPSDCVVVYMDPCRHDGLPLYCGDRNALTLQTLARCDPDEVIIVAYDNAIASDTVDMNIEEPHHRKPRRRGGKRVTARRNRERDARAAALAAEASGNNIEENESTLAKDHYDDKDASDDIRSAPALQLPPPQRESESDSEPEPGEDEGTGRRRRPPRAGRKRTRQLRRQAAERAAASDANRSLSSAVKAEGPSRTPTRIHNPPVPRSQASSCPGQIGGMTQATNGASSSRTPAAGSSRSRSHTLHTPRIHNSSPAGPSVPSPSSGSAGSQPSRSSNDRSRRWQRSRHSGT
ncbi:uncharacterized protein LAESUDRAFT_324598 [Laetiporus sulphureus 93-53]|uniref:Uncharacterized protein n=1 Tax=Laetiporus sulphureus 93-53 TaxID=1314785 RepID=A0A165CYP9_9APHY|nr:uncharacterized protein LAESUDRAFT_324598 [Laetiporus sulphureus 93-53]KZT03764.1 hypothetical protein LAESUDRAFT_324598 [Laetiporus sulphureus 93-53]